MIVSSIQNPWTGNEANHELEQELAGREDVYIITVDGNEYGVGDGCDYSDAEDFLCKRAEELGSLDQLAKELCRSKSEFVEMLLEEDLDGVLMDVYDGFYADEISKEPTI